MGKIKNSGFNRYEPPSPSIVGDENIEESFLKDLDKIHDELPQPFRRIDKLLSTIFDDIWQLIEKKDKENLSKLSSQSQINKVLYEEELLLREKVVAIVATDHYIFLTCSTKILVYSTPSLTFVTKHDKSEVENSYMETSIILASNSEVLLLTKNSNNSVQVIGFKNETFQLIVSHTDEINNDATLETLYISEDCNFMSVFFSIHERQWITVYKLKKDDWASQLSNVVQQINLETADEEDAEKDGVNEVQFSKIQTLFKINTPTVTPNPNSLSATMKSIDSESILLSYGSHHMLTAAYFDNLKLEVQSKIKKKNLDIYKKSEGIALVRFLKGQTSTSLFQSRKTTTDFGCNAIAVCWTNGNQIFFYHLKAGKDSDPSPYLVIPHSHKIKLMEVNSLTNLIATVVVNNCLCIWNRYTGVPLKVLSPSTRVDINFLKFSTIYYGDMLDCLTYGTTDGKLLQVVCEAYTASDPVYLDNRLSLADKDSDIVIKSFSCPMNILSLIWSSGDVVLYNEASKLPICQLELFNNDLLTKINSSHIHVTFSSSNIFVIRDETNENNSVESSRLFLFKCDTDPNLQQYFHHGLFNDMGEETEKVDSLEKLFFQILHQRNLLDESLHDRVSKQYQKVLENNISNVKT